MLFLLKTKKRAHAWNSPGHAPRKQRSTTTKMTILKNLSLVNKKIVAIIIYAQLQNKIQIKNNFAIVDEIVKLQQPQPFHNHYNHKQREHRHKTGPHHKLSGKLCIIVHLTCHYCTGDCNWRAKECN